MWNNKAPWNDEGKRRIAEVMQTQGGRKGLGWGFPLMMSASTPVQFLITPEETIIVNAYKETRQSTPTGAITRPWTICGRPSPAIRSATGKATRL